jgi:hypothetical protein
LCEPQFGYPSCNLIANSLCVDEHVDFRKRNSGKAVRQAAGNGHRRIGSQSPPITLVRFIRSLWHELQPDPSLNQP